MSGYVIFSFLTAGVALWALFVFYRASSNMPELSLQADPALRQDRENLLGRRIAFYVSGILILAGHAYLWWLAEPGLMWLLVGLFSPFLYFDARGQRFIRAAIDQEAQWFESAGSPIPNRRAVSGEIIYEAPDLEDHPEVESHDKGPPSMPN